MPRKQLCGIALVIAYVIAASPLCAQQSDSVRVRGDSVAVEQTSEPAPQKEYHTTFSLSPSFGVTLQSETEEDKDIVAAQWLAGLESKLFMDGEPFQFGAQLYAKYGQSHSENAEPRKTQDKLILSLTPSMTILPGIGIRLFLETTAETQMKSAIVDDSITSQFLDPLFLYQMLFLGKRFAWTSEDEDKTFTLTTGVGYALQQTVAEKFILQQNRNFVVTENSPLSSVQDAVTLESGYSAMFDMSYENNLSHGFMLNTAIKTVALTKESFFDDVQNARVTSLFSLGLSYKSLSLDYSGTMTYDRNVSLRRALEQALVFGVKLKL